MDHEENKKRCKCCGELNNMNAVICYNCKESLKDAVIVDKDKDVLQEYLNKIDEKNNKHKKARILYFTSMFLLLTAILVFATIYNKDMINTIQSMNHSHFQGKIYFLQFIFAYIILILCTIGNFKPNLLFRFRYKSSLLVRDAEPSELYFTISKIFSYIVSFALIVYFLLIYLII